MHLCWLAVGLIRVELFFVVLMLGYLYLFMSACFVIPILQHEDDKNQFHPDPANSQST
jgi:hypothetical protein